MPSWEDVRARRLARSRLIDRAQADQLVEVARGTCGIHAQVQASAELQLAARTDDLSRDAVRGALWTERTLVKAWTIRGTLHLHPADELSMWHAAGRAVSGPPAGLDEWRDPQGVLHPGLDRTQADEARAAVKATLDGRCLTREQLASELEGEIGPAATRRLEAGFAFLIGDLCQGPPQGARVTLARPDQWIDGWREADEETSLHEVCRRFLRAYGPARPRDLAEWLGARAFPVSRARALFDTLADDLESIAVDGHEAFVLANDTRFPELTTSVRLLSEYDVYVMGFREREHLVPESVRALVAGHGRGRYEGPAGVRFVFVDGVARGLWERQRRGRRLELRITLAGRLTRALRTALTLEAERLGGFLDGDLSISFT